MTAPVTLPTPHPWEAPPKGPAARTAAALAAAVPVIATERLTLRAPRVTDFDAYAAIFMSDRARFMGGPYDREGAWADFTQAVAGWLLRGMGAWTIEARADGAVLGFLFLWQEFGDPEPELDWALIEAAEGKGYALEAARATLPHALALFGPGRLVSYIDEGNTASARLAERLGAVRDPAAELSLGDPALQIWRHGSAAAPRPKGTP
jgi:RimJ/RimL family protein N-acetyltransferase